MGDREDESNGDDRRQRSRPIVDEVFIATTFTEIAGQMRMIRATMQGIKADVEVIGKAGYIPYNQLVPQVLNIPQIRTLLDEALKREGAFGVWKFIAGGGGVLGVVGFLLAVAVALKWIH